MQNRRFFICAALLIVTAWFGTAHAGEVRVFKPMEEGMSAQDLRVQALAEGFSQAVLEEAKGMLSSPLDEVRTELFREYLLAHAKPYIQGYKTLSSEASEAGLILRLDVRVNKTTLRDGLKRMGLAATVVQPQPAAVVWPEDLDDEAKAQLQGLVTLTGLQLEADILPSFTLEKGKEKGTYKARLELDDREWVAIKNDMAVLWFELWGRFFSRSEAAGSEMNFQKLTVNGWFSPDAVLEFDRVLRSWDSSVQDVRLIEMDMQPTGVGGSWEYRLLNQDRFNMQLRSFLPQRGLSYSLAEDAK